MNSRAAGAGSRGQPTLSQRDYNQGDNQAASVGGGQYRQGTVRPVHHQTPHTPRGKQFLHACGDYFSTSVQQHLLKPTPNFNALIKKESFNDIEKAIIRFGISYDGRNHSKYASTIVKLYSSTCRRPLNRNELNQLMPLLQNFKPSPNWSCRSLATVFHSFTSAGVFKPQKLTDQAVEDIHAALLVAYLDAVSRKGNQRPLASDIGAQSIANLLWAMAKLVDNGLELTPELKQAVAALLPHVKAQKSDFKPQEIANLLWAMAKLVDNGLELTPELKQAVAELLPYVKAPKDPFDAQGIANLLWAMAKLVDNGLELTPELKQAVAALLPHVKSHKDQFNPQGITNLLWAMAKLVNNRLELTPELKEAIAALLPRVNAQKTYFRPQHIGNLLWAMAKLVDNGLDLTPELKAPVAALLSNVNTQKDPCGAQGIANLMWAMAKMVDNGLELIPELTAPVVALLPHVKAHKDPFNARDIANLMWAMAKMVDNGLKLTPKPKEVVAALLLHVNAQTDQFNPQHIANLLWAMAKLVDNGLELTPELKEAVATLLPQVNAQKANFKPQEIANLLWAMAKLGGLIKTGVALSTSVSLVHELGEYGQFTQQELLIILWSLLACSARLYFDGNADGNDFLQQSINKLFTHVKNELIDSEQDKITLTMAAHWLDAPCLVTPHYQTTMSRYHTDLHHQLSSALPSVKIEKEKSIDSLPPVDLLLPEYNIVIEVQGPHHYVGCDFQTRNGSTLLKIALLHKSGYEVIEVPVNQLRDNDSVQAYIAQIKKKVAAMAVADGSISLISGGDTSDKEYFTADEGGEPLDESYFTADEGIEEQEWKTKKKKRKRGRRKTSNNLPSRQANPNSPERFLTSKT